MRRHIMLAEQFRLMSLLIESRESAIFDKFTPLIVKMQVSALDMNTMLESDLLNKSIVVMPAPWTQNKEGKASLKSLLTIPERQVDKLTPEQQHVRSEAIAHGIITMVWAADPNPKKAYTTWLLTRYVAGNIKLEDLNRIKSYLEIYERVKLRLPVEFRDINRFKSSNDLFDVVKDFREENGEIVTASQEKQMLEQSEVIYNGPDYLILSPRTQDSSCYFGRGTEWCTAYVPPKTNNMFNTYNNKGRLYIVTDKSDGEKWQFHRETASFMDKNDRHIDIVKWLGQHPKVDEIFNKYFNINSAKIIGKLTDTLFCYFGKNGTDYVLWIAKEGFVPGGLIDTGSTSIKIVANENKEVTTTSGIGRLPEGSRSGLILKLEEIGFSGDTTDLRNEDIIWQDGKYNGFLDLTPVAKDKGVEVRKTGSGNNFILHFTSVADGVYNDVCDLEVSPGRNDVIGLEYKTYTNTDLIDMSDLFSRVLVEYIPEGCRFDIDNSSEKLPFADIWYKKRPNLADIKTLYDNLGGDSDLVIDRVCSFLHEVDYGWSGHARLPGQNDIILRRYPNIVALIDYIGDESAKVIASDDLGIYAETPDISDVTSDLLESLDAATLKKLIAYLNKEYADDLGDIGIEDGITDISDIETLLDEGFAEELKEALEHAAQDGEEVGTRDEAYSALHKAVEENPNIVFDNNGKYHYATEEPGFIHDTPCMLVATVKEMFDADVFTDPDSVESSDLSGDWIDELVGKIEIDEPRYGWSNYDEKAASERFGELVYEFLPND